MQKLLSDLNEFISDFQAGSIRLTDFPGQYPALFWAGLLVVALLLVVILVIVAGARRKRTEQQIPLTRQKDVRVFVPVESASMGPDTMLLPLTERIVDCGAGISQEVAQRIILDAPDSLSAVSSAYPRCTPTLQRDLRQLVRDTHILEAYGRRICVEGLPLGVLADAWAWFSDADVLHGYVDLMTNPDQQVQLNAVRLLSSLQDTRCLPMLVAALTQPERFVPSRVAEVFASMPEKSAAMLAVMLPDLDDKHKVRVLETMAQSNCPFPLENVLTCLHHKDYNVRVAAALALGASRMTDCVPELMMSAGDKRWQVRAAAAKALGMIGDSRCLSVLHGLAGDKEGWVAANAQEALQLFENA